MLIQVTTDIQSTVISGPFLLAGLLALAAGVVSFASPCVVPLVPGYLSYLAGLVGSESRLSTQAVGVPLAAGQASRVVVTSGDDGLGSLARADRVRVRWRALAATALFVAGFSVVFIAESALVLGVYTSIIANQALLSTIAGVVSILMGVVLLLPALQREWRPGMGAWVSRRQGAGRARTASAAAGADGDHAASKSDGSVPARATARGRLWGAPILGAAFGTGWLACTSPTLAGIIALSSATEWNGSAVRGLALVALYCAGLGVPFLLLALGFGWAGGAIGFLKRHARTIQFVGASALILIGIAMLTGLWGAILSPLQGTALLL